MASVYKKGVNDLETYCKEHNLQFILDEWDYEKNGKLNPSDFGYGSTEHVWWRCSNNHPSWNTTIRNRTLGSKCPYCQHQKVLSGINDLETLFPEVASEWNYSKNDKKPSEVFPSSNKKAWWKCKKCGNEWEAVIGSRIRGNGCPACGRKKAEKGMHYTRMAKIGPNGSFGDIRPDLASQWNYEKNELKPTDYTPHSNKKVWWICKKGHEWQASINSRYRSFGCPQCNKERGTSFPEQAICYYLSLVTKVDNRFIYDGFEIDIYLSELKIGIEYDGMHFHSSKKAREREERKNEYLKNHQIKLIRIKETKEVTSFSFEQNVIFYPYKDNYKNIDQLILFLANTLNFPISDVNHDRDRSKIYEQYIQGEKENSVVVKCPALKDEWDYEKNGKLNPEYFSYSSGHKVWWKCKKCGNSWQAVISSRAVGNGCPYCSNDTLLKGFNDLKTLNPPFMNEWDYEKNVNIDPSTILGYPKIKVWWKCKTCGHEWLASIDKRHQGRGCPVCKQDLGRKKRSDAFVIQKGSIFDKYPELMDEWNYEKNTSFDPRDLTPGSGKKVWWKCKTCGHEWETIIKNRTSGHGCPHCSSVKANERINLSKITDDNSLAALYPSLMLEWDYERNGELNPSLLLPGSSKHVWWKCKNCGHSWTSSISNRTKGRNCPECAKNRKSVKNQNSK